MRTHAVCLSLCMTLLATLWLSGPALQAAPPAPQRPNILLIVADDLGWGDVGWHRGFAQTPVMDRLVAEGVELDRHYVQPVCTPTRTALLSGRYPGRFGPQALAPSNLRALAPGTPTLASALRSLGYETSLCGKWHLGAKPQWGPNHYGFDHSYGSLTGAADPWTHLYRPKSPYKDTWHRDLNFFQEQGNATELVAAEALKQISSGRTDAEGHRVPWFVYVPFHAVHTPVDTPPEYKKLYDGVVFDADPARQDSRLRMAAMVSQLDAKIGAFLSALETTGQRSNTLIIFTSDNGGTESLKNGYEGTVADSPLNSENAPLRGQKNQFYEGGIRVCAFANWPGVLAPRKVTAALHAVDWFPTLARLTGYTPPPAIAWDGVDRWDALAGPGPAPRPKPIYIAKKKGATLIDGSWKLIAPGGSETPELYDLASDPFETTDLAAQRSDQMARLESLLAKEQALDVTELPADLVGIHD